MEIGAWTRGPPGSSDAQSEVRTLRLAVVDANAHIATGFWLRQGFEPTGEERRYRYDKLESTAQLYEKQLREQRAG